MRAVPVVAFLLSGVSGLIFESVWTRMLHHVFGASSAAQSTVLTVFMAGLALGAWVTGRWADRLRRPLLFYALAELGIAAWGLLVPVLLAPDGWLADVNATLRDSLGLDSTGFLFARFACVAPILLVPSTLMGATLPLLARVLAQGSPGGAKTARTVGLLYAANTVGAVLGSFGAGFVLLPGIGLAWTNRVAAAINGGIALGLWLLRKRLQWGSQRAASEPGTASGPPPEPLSGTQFGAPTRWVAFGAFAISGAAALCYEVVWSRALALVAGSSIYAFTLMLTTFLLGIAGGSALAAHIVGREEPLRLRLLGFLGAAVAVLIVVLVILVGPELRSMVLTGAWSIGLLVLLIFSLRQRPLLLLALVQLYIGGATLASALWIDEFPAAVARYLVALDAPAAQASSVYVLVFLLSGLCMLPGALGMGAMFPLALRVWSSGGARVGRDVGTLYAGNTVGSILGAWLPGFVLFEAWGLERTLHGAVTLNVLAGLAVLVAWVHSRSEPRRPARTIAVYGGTVAMLGLLAFAWGSRVGQTSLGWDLTRMTMGAFRMAVAEQVHTSAPLKRKLLYYRDGRTATVSVEQVGGGLAMRVNGKVDASSSGDMSTQVLVGAAPLLMHQAGPRGLDVVVIGFGSGVSVGSALGFPVRSVAAIELEPAVLQASRFFARWSGLRYPLRQSPWVQAPRLRVVSDDARSFIAAATRGYDVITSEPSNPWIAGVADLFTVDHFTAAKSRLRPGGIYGQWMQLYELSPRSIKTVLRTFASVFRHVVVFASERLSTDTVLLGSDSPLPLDVTRVDRALRWPGVATVMKRAKIRTPGDLFARVLFANRAEVLQYARLEQRRSGDGWHDVPGSLGAGPCPPATCRRRPAPVNTYDNALLEFTAPREIFGFRQFRNHVKKWYREGWPYGRLPGKVIGLGSGGNLARANARMALSLVHHRRPAEAETYLRLAIEVGGAPEVAIAREALRRLRAKLLRKLKARNRGGRDAPRAR